MATSAVFNAASPHEIVFTASGDGGALAVAAATIYSAFSNLGMTGGPLLAKLRRTADWTAFNLGGAECDRLHVREVVNRAAAVDGGEASSVKFFWTAAGFSVDCTGTCQIEIRLQHSERF